jgi:hypothetical protein
MAFQPLIPEPQSKRTLSHAIRAWKFKYIHQLNSVQGHQRIRNQFSITDWLLIGCCLQSAIILLTPFPLIDALAPTFLLAGWKVLKTVLITVGVMENYHMKGVRVGRATAVFPNPDGTFERKVGESVGGEGMCIILLSSKVHQYITPFPLILSYS